MDPGLLPCSASDLKCELS